MTTFATFSNGDTNYVATLNGNFATIRSILDGITSILSGATGGGSSSLAAYQALFGQTVSVIGAGSYGCTGSSATLTVAAGFMWSPSTGKVLAQAVSSTLDFTGQSAATYYVSVDPTGAPVRNATLVADAIYSVVWTGSAFGTITRLAAIVWGAADDIAAQASAALATSFSTLDARFEAGETLAALGALARTWQTGRLSLSVAGSADVTLNAVQANNAVLDFTGALTGNINVIVPLGANPREWIVTNNTTGAFSLTIKGATGTGVAVTQGGFSNLYQDGTNVKAVSGSGAGSGDVVGPGSATNNHVAVFSGTTGKLIADSGLTLSGTNTGDQTTVSGNAGTATALQTARTIGGVSFDGSANIALTAASINGLQGSGLTANDVGFRTIPQNSQSAAYTTVAADSGKHILHPAADTTARTFTIDSNANVAYPIGTAITIVNENSAGVVTIAITSDTMRLAGAGTTGSRTLAANGIATALKITSTSWIISGTGLT